MKIALLFPGSGSQFLGMGKALYDHYPIARETFNEASESMNLSYHKICMEDDSDQLKELAIAQTSIFVCSIAAFRVYKQEIGITPHYAAGHSLGEYAALVSAGAVSFTEALRLVQFRSHLMEKAADTVECLVIAVNNIQVEAVKAEVKKFQHRDQIIDIACLNRLDQTVVSGHKVLIEQLIPKLEAIGGRVTCLPIAVPVHSRIMLSVATQFREKLSEISFQETLWPVISNVSALPYENKAEIINQLTRQLTSPVQWLNTLLFMQRKGISHSLELGPKSTLTAFTKKIARNIQAASIESDPLLQSIKNWKQRGGNIYERCLAMAVAAENRCLDSTEYQKGCIEPYQQLMELKREAELYDGELPVAHKSNAFQLLSRILTTKQMELSEQRRKFKLLLEAVGETSLIMQLN